MNLARQLRVPLALLLLLLAGQWLLERHLQSAPGSLYPPLREPFENLTAELKGKEEWKWNQSDAYLEHCEKSRARQLKQMKDSDNFVPESFLLRYYDCLLIRSSVSVSMVHSEKGFDRRHHPEICLGDVKGMSEELGSRKVIVLASATEGALDPKAVQCFRFRSRDLSQPAYTVYYWHYTFRPQDSQELTALQVFNRLFNQAPPSVSIQVWLATPIDQLDRRAQRESQVEQSFLPALDRELRARHLPGKVKMQCDRIVMGLNQ